jgi:PST family polysaccharide transporter
MSATAQLEEDPGTAASSPLARNALRGVAWNWAGSALLIVAQICSTAATARLVSPSQFGQYAAALAASGFAGYFTLSGLGPGIQRRTRLGERTAGTAMTLSLVASMLVAILIWAGASLWSRLWGIPDATWVIRVIALTVLFTSASIVPIALLRRGFRFRTAAAVETGALVIGLATGVALAARLHSAMALAIGQATGGAVQVLAAVVLARGQLALEVDRADARELLRFSTQVSGLNLFLYFDYAAPSWFAARTFGAATLGVYSRASLIVGLPSEYALTSVYKVIYPVYGRVREDPARTRVLIDEALTLTTGLIWPFLGLVAGAAPVIVAVLLGGRWGDAPPLVSLFALIACAWVPCGVLTNAAEAQGWMRIIATRQVALFGGIVAAMLVAYLADLSLTWLLAGIAATEWAAYALTLQPFIRRKIIEPSVTLRKQLVHAAIALGGFAAAGATALALDGAPLGARLAAEVAVGIVVLGAILAARRRIPAMQVLARRIGVPAEGSFLRSAWAALR